MKPVDPDTGLIAMLSREAAEVDRGIWSHGDCLLVHRQGYSFPDQCLICNASAERQRYGLRLAWMPDAGVKGAIAFHLIGPLGHVMALAVFARFVRLRVPLCRRHVWRRRRALAFAYLSIPAMLVASFVCILLGNSHVSLLVILAMFSLAGTLYGFFSLNSLKAGAIDRRFVLIRGVAPDFLASVPKAPNAEGI